MVFWRRTVIKMMRYYLFLFVALLFGACSTLEVQHDYDPSYDFSKVKSFAIVHKQKEGEDGLTIKRIEKALAKALEAKGLVPAQQQKADLIFLFHLNVTNKTEIYTDYQMVGYGRYGGMVIATPRSYNYDEGKLIIDAYDPKINQTVYRVVLTDELKERKTPKEREEYIDEAIRKALKSFLPRLSKK